MRRAPVAVFALIISMFFLTVTACTSYVAPRQDRPVLLAHWAQPDRLVPRHPAGVAATVEWITVRPGDTLSAITARRCGSPSGWPLLWAVNRRLVHDPALIMPGWRLRPAACGPVSVGLLREATTAIPRPQPAIAPVRSVIAVATTVSYTGPSSGFQACVIARESGGYARAYNTSSGASGLYGFLLSTWMHTPEGPAYPGGAYTAPPAVQTAAFWWTYARDGTAPWAPYDGC